jgi:hypothetical protein
MPEVLELEPVQMSQPGERRSPDPDLGETREPPTLVEIHQETSLPPATPERLIIGNLNHSHLRLRAPITVSITRDEALLIASIPELDEFGYGTHLTAAIEDLRQTLIELFQTLKSEQARLGPGMLKPWNPLQNLIEER